MRQISKRALYESIMRNIAKQVKKALNESYNYVPRNKEELLQIIRKRIQEEGPNCDLNDIDVSHIKDMSSLFYGYDIDFNGDISLWDVSHVTNMSHMFDHSKFNGDISLWDVSNVIDMSDMFYGSLFTGDISNWDVHHVEDMSYMFFGSVFDGDLSKWDVRNVDDMFFMFVRSKFNGDISNWEISKWCRTKSKDIFDKCPLENQPEKQFKNKYM